MADFDFKLNLAGLNELMKSAEMQSVLEDAGQRVASAPGGSYGSRVHTASFVAICNVYPEDANAAKDNAKNNTLLKALGSVKI